jgi:hypothetical protein
MCSSPFVSDQWRMNVTRNLVSDLSIYSTRDYRRFLSAHLQFLSGLCDLSIQSMTDSVEQFLASFFVTAQLLPQGVFYERINLLIDQSKSNAPVTFTRLLSILRTTNHGNAIISAYGTNYQYIDPLYNVSDPQVQTQTVSYDDGCSCALNANCTTQAGFVTSNSTEILPIKGLKIGCTPSESFLASTLECFYDISCINLIQQQMGIIDKMDTSDIPLSLSVNTSRFPINTTIIDLIQNLFIENWSTTINYSAYFGQCAPTLCSYTYIQKLNSLYTVTVLLGLCGGLTLALQWICPNVIYLLAKMQRYWRKRRNIVEPASTIQIAPIESTNATLKSRDACRVTINSTSISTVSTSSYTTFFFSFNHNIQFSFLEQNYSRH